MKLSKVLVAAVLSFSGASAFADGESNGTGLFLEPGVTYQVGESNIDYAGGSNSAAVTRGFGLVGRAGIHVWERFFVAADARYAFLNFNDNSNNYQVKAQSWDIAPVVGFQMKDYGVRLYGGYVLAGNLDPKGKDGFDPKFEEATGWRVGAGLKLEQVSVNIEWQRIHYGKADLKRAGSSTPTNIDYNPDGLVASVTFPFEFN